MMTDDQMIDELNFKDFARFYQLCCYLYILFAWSRITGRVKEYQEKANSHVPQPGLCTT